MQVNSTVECSLRAEGILQCMNVGSMCQVRSPLFRGQPFRPAPTAFQAQGASGTLRLHNSPVLPLWNPTAHNSTLPKPPRPPRLQRPNAPADSAAYKET